MDVIQTFFADHLTTIYFLYGLAFFVTGIVVFIGAGCARYLPMAHSLPYLTAFGLLHGSHEWIEMAQRINASPPTVYFRTAQITALAVSFILLIEFGVRLLTTEEERRWKWVRWGLWILFTGGLIAVFLIWGGNEAWRSADTWCRYSLAIPGALLTAAGFHRHSRLQAYQQTGTRNHLHIVGILFLLYGIPGQLFVSASSLPPSTVLSSALFFDVLHFPVQLWRALCATGIAILMSRATRLYEISRRRQLDEAVKARLEAQRRLNDEMEKRQNLQRALFRQVVWAQEEERKHIARELHDETSQALTALSWRLASVEEALPAGLEEPRRRLEEVRHLTERVMNDLRRLTARLRPRVLDELGLVPALITYADECCGRLPFDVNVEVLGERRRLPSEVEVTLYRITQEALTNVVKHAQATQAKVTLEFEDQEVRLSVSDNGVGMDVAQARQAATEGRGWGLAGIEERLELLDGEIDLQSSPGEGTKLKARIPCMPGQRRNASQVKGGYDADSVDAGR
jgi:signal transduction histidine kinase